MSGDLRGREGDSHDVDLQRRVINFLHHCGVPGSDRILVRAQCGVLTVQGPVDSDQVRRLCLACCRRVAGVIRVIDELEIPLRRYAVPAEWRESARHIRTDRGSASAVPSSSSTPVSRGSRSQRKPLIDPAM